MSRLLMDLKPSNIPLTLAIPMDWRVVLFTAGVSMATGVVFGLAPALRASSGGGGAGAEGRVAGGEPEKSRGLRNALVVAQMAMCVVLLAGAALCVRSLMNANAIDAGFDTHHIALATLDPGSLGYTPAEDQRLLHEAVAAGGAAAGSNFGELRAIPAAGHVAV